MPRVIWSSGNCTLYVRGERENERERGARSESLRKIVAHSGRSRGRGKRERVYSRRGKKRKNIRDARGINRERQRERRETSRYSRRKKEEKYKIVVSKKERKKEEGKIR